MKFFLLYVRFAFEYALANKTLSHIKYYKRSHKDILAKKTPIDRQLPWITYDAIDFLAEICKPEMRVFEWGSGGSTLFFASRCKEVVSIEHDLNWKGFVEEKIKELSFTNSVVKTITGVSIDNFEDKDYRNPTDFVSRDENSIGLSYESYAKAIDEYPEGYFDIVVVDGRVRNSCIYKAMPHIKEGGYLIVDNSDRKYYLNPFPELNDSVKWEKVEFQGPVSTQYSFCKTSFFKKL